MLVTIVGVRVQDVSLSASSITTWCNWLLALRAAENIAFGAPEKITKF